MYWCNIFDNHNPFPLVKFCLVPGCSKNRLFLRELLRVFLQADWVTQRQRCGSDVVYWLCLDSGLRAALATVNVEDSGEIHRNPLTIHEIPKNGISSHWWFGDVFWWVKFIYRQTSFFGIVQGFLGYIQKSYNQSFTSVLTLVFPTEFEQWPFLKDGWDWDPMNSSCFVASN